MAGPDLTAEIAAGVKEWLNAKPETRRVVYEAMVANLKQRRIADADRMIDEAIRKATTLKAARERKENKRAGNRTPLPPTRGDKRPEIIIDADEHRVNDEALRALAADPDVYARGQRLVRVVRRCDGGVPVIQDLPQPSLRELLTRHARFMRVTREGFRPAHPPDWTVAALATRGELASIRQLAGIVTASTMRTDGTILDEPGFDPATSLILAPLGEVLRVPFDPSWEATAAARDELLGVVSDFPFSGRTEENGSAYRSAWLASVLTMFARHGITGNVPAFLVDANTRGSGKGLLVDTIAVIATGRPISRSPQPREDEEMRKQITAAAIGGTPAVLIDNMTGKVSYRSLENALTCNGLWSDRILGRSERRIWPLTTIWFLTSNNAALSSDMARRVLPIRLQSDVENPEDRRDFRHADLIGWIGSQRSRLAQAALTCLRAFHMAGRPQEALAPWGSFEGWSALIRQCVVWLGLPDPIAARVELRARADVDRDAILVLLRGIQRLAPAAAELSAADLLKHLESDGDLRSAVFELCPPRAGDNLPTVQRLGVLLRSLRDRVVDGLRLEGRSGHGGALRWRVQCISPAGSDTHRPHHNHHGGTDRDGESGEHGEDVASSAKSRAASAAAPGVDR